MKEIGKICVLVAVIAAYYFCGGFAPPVDRYMGKLFRVMDVLLLFGLYGALWGGNVQIGVLQPVSLRPIFILLGCLAILGVFIVTVATRSDRKPHPAIAVPNVTNAPSLMSCPTKRQPRC